jgi:hypothetical protein
VEERFITAVDGSHLWKLFAVRKGENNDSVEMRANELGLKLEPCSLGAHLLKTKN